MGSNKESKRHPKGTLVWRTGLSGVPPDSIRCTRELDAELATFGKIRGRSTIIHRTVRCASRATATLRQRSAATALNALQCAPESEHAQKGYRTVYRTCPVHHRTAQMPHQSELQRSEPNGRLTWLAHRTVQCAMRQTASQRPLLVVGAIKTPTTPQFSASKFSNFLHLTRAIAFNIRHTKEIKPSPKALVHPKSNK
jgi:hypothetical protein